MTLLEHVSVRWRRLGAGSQLSQLGCGALVQKRLPAQRGQLRRNESVKWLHARLSSQSKSNSEQRSLRP